MYTVRLQITDKRTKKTEETVWTIPGDPGEEQYESKAEELSEILYDLDILYDDTEGEGDMLMDDIAIHIAEGEDFDETFKGRKNIFRILGNSGERDTDGE